MNVCVTGPTRDLHILNTEWILINVGPQYIYIYGKSKVCHSKVDTLCYFGYRQDFVIFMKTTWNVFRDLYTIKILDFRNFFMHIWGRT